MRKLAALVMLSLLYSAQMTFAEVKTALFSGGCFWCMQADLDRLKGVVKTEVGYSGGKYLYPDYKSISRGDTDHLEVVKVWYEDEVLSYQRLIDYFFRHIDPTVRDQQFCDIGKQYQSAILYQNKAQEAQAKQQLYEVKRLLNKPVYTKILPATRFYVAEESHQKYYLKNPLSYAFYRWQCGRDARLEKIWDMAK